MNNRLSTEFINQNTWSAAQFSKDKKYRFTLRRVFKQTRRKPWLHQFGQVMFLMLNPSTADADANDRTVDRCMRWALKWQAKSIIVCNLFAYIETDRTKMIEEAKKGADIVGPKNDYYIYRAARDSETIICGWGNEGQFGGRAEHVIDLLRGFDLWALKINKNGAPGHPLYLKSDAAPIIFRRRQNIDKLT